MKTLLTAGLGELVISADPTQELACLGLGSCIAICAYDARRHLGAMLHVVLPTGGDKDQKALTRYADTAVPLMAERLAAHGARLASMRVALCGGAAIFPPLQGIMDIGIRNLDAVRNGLKRLGVLIHKEEVGGTESRTIILELATGAVRLRTVRMGEIAWLGQMNR